jgi:predicted CopG family antitoxin
MPEISLDEETIERLDRLRVDEESYDEVVSELINIYETEERTLFRGGSP